MFLRVAAIVLVCAGLVYTLHGIHWRAVGDAMRSATLWPIVLAAVLNFGILAGKAGAWRILLAPEYEVPVGRLARYTLLSYASSVILPLRAGELLRVWLLRDREGVPTARTAAVAIAEKLLDILSMALVMLPVPWLVQALPAATRWWVCGIAVLAVLGVIGLWLASRRITSQRWLGRVIAGLEVLGRARRVLAVIALLVGTWLIDLAMMDLVLYAIGLDLPFADGLIVLLGVNVAIAVPSTPAQLGALELGAIGALRLLHVDEAAALAFAVLYHTLQVIPVVAVALIMDYRLLVPKVSRATGHS